MEGVFDQHYSAPIAVGHAMHVVVRPPVEVEERNCDIGGRRETRRSTHAVHERPAENQKRDPETERKRLGKAQRDEQWEQCAWGLRCRGGEGPEGGETECDGTGAICAILNLGAFLTAFGGTGSYGPLGLLPLILGFAPGALWVFGISLAVLRAQSSVEGRGSSLPRSPSPSASD